VCRVRAALLEVTDEMDSDQSCGYRMGAGEGDSEGGEDGAGEGRRRAERKRRVRGRGRGQGRKEGRGMCVVVPLVLELCAMVALVVEKPNLVLATQSCEKRLPDTSDAM
jgi:hypothetical protein